MVAVRIAHEAVWAAWLATLALTVAACSPTEGGGAVEIDVDLWAGQAWTARGPAVDDDVVCAAGDRKTVEIRDVDGQTPLGLDDAQQRLAAGAASGEPALVTFAIEMTCEDGSGTVAVIEDPTNGTWHVVGGTGAYVDLVGSGAFTVEYSDAASTEERSPDDPPNDAPLALHWTGEMRRPDRGD